MTIRQLSPELSKIANEELFEDSKRLQDDIQNIKDWIAKQPHLKARIDDQWLVAFLRGCKFSLERAKKKLDLYYTLRVTAADITKRLRPTEEKFYEILRTGACLILPKSSDIAPRIILLKIGALDVKKHTIIDLICVFYYLVQILIYEDDTTTVVGTKILVDYQNFDMSHITQTSLFAIKKIIFIIQESVPLRLKGSHHINLPPSLETMFTLVKGLLNEKTNKRLVMHKTNKELVEYFKEKSIPIEYGGSGGTVKDVIEYWVKKCEDYRSWMEQEDGFGTNESKRMGKPQSAEDMFGIEGSFRKLELD